jgi:hypothetical protein
MFKAGKCSFAFSNGGHNFVDFTHFQTSGVNDHKVQRFFADFRQKIGVCIKKPMTRLNFGLTLQRPELKTPMF